MHNRSALTGIVGLVLACVCGAQIDTPRTPPEKDVRDLYARASASQLVVVGTVLPKGKAVFKRVPANVEAVRASLNDPPEGYLRLIAVEEVLCRQSDFRAPGAEEQPVRSEHRLADIFVPRYPLFVGEYPKEALVPGRRYLLFLVSPSPEQQKEWVDSLELEPDHVYYRGEEASRGVIPLAQPTPGNPNPEQPPVLDKVTRLCQAVRPADLNAKLIALKKLADSDDPVLRREAEAAMDALKRPR